MKPVPKLEQAFFIVLKYCWPIALVVYLNNLQVVVKTT